MGLRVQTRLTLRRTQLGSFSLVREHYTKGKPGKCVRPRRFKLRVGEGLTLIVRRKGLRGISCFCESIDVVVDFFFYALQIYAAYATDLDWEHPDDWYIPVADLVRIYALDNRTVNASAYVKPKGMGRCNAHICSSPPLVLAVLKNAPMCFGSVRRSSCASPAFFAPAFLSYYLLAFAATVAVKALAATVEPMEAAKSPTFAGAVGYL